jgi:hypothetical protein
MASIEAWEVTNVINLYAVALDSRRYDLFPQIFTEDVRCDFGGGAAWTDRASLMLAFDAIHAGFAATQHIVAGHTIRIDGSDAWCVSYVNARFLKAIDGKTAVFESTGWYDDRLRRTDAGWRTSRMVSAGGEHRVMQAMPEIDTEFVLLSLADEAAAGRVAFFAGLRER